MGFNVSKQCLSVLADNIIVKCTVHSVISMFVKFDKGNQLKVLVNSHTLNAYHILLLM